MSNHLSFELFLGETESERSKEKGANKIMRRHASKQIEWIKSRRRTSKEATRRLINETQRDGATAEKKTKSRGLRNENAERYTIHGTLCVPSIMPCTPCCHSSSGSPSSEGALSPPASNLLSPPLLLLLLLLPPSCCSGATAVGLMRSERSSKTRKGSTVPAEERRRRDATEVGPV